MALLPQQHLQPVEASSAARCEEPAAPAAEAPAAEAAPAAAEKITVIFPKHEADIKGAFEARIREFEKESGITG